MCVVAWSSVLLQDCSFWNFKLCIFIVNSIIYIWKFVWLQVPCVSISRHMDTTIIMFSRLSIWIFQQIRQCFFWIFYTFNIFEKNSTSFFLIYFFRIWLHGRVVNINLNVVDMLVDVVDMLSFGNGYVYWCSEYVCWYIIKTIVDVMINIIVVVMDTIVMNAFATI